MRLFVHQLKGDPFLPYDNEKRGLNLFKGGEGKKKRGFLRIPHLWEGKEENVRREGGDFNISQGVHVSETPRLGEGKGRKP